MKPEDPITVLKGIGEKTAVLFAKAGIHTVGDLLEHYPRNYETYEELVEPAQLEDGRKQAVQGMVLSVSAVKRSARYQVFTAQIRVGQEQMEGVWFNMPFLRSYFQRGGQYVFRGIVSQKGNRYQMEQPEHYTLG